MRSRRLVVPVLFFLSGLGWAATHAVVHRAVTMTEPEAAPGPGDYLSYLATSTGLCLALALSLAAGALAGRRRRGATLRSLWLFGLIPLLGFAGHSAFEPILTGETAMPGLAGLAPVALVGLAIQIPFALLAMAVARQVLVLAEGLAHALIPPARARARRPAAPTERPSALRLPDLGLALAHPGRGPPRRSA
ncbi:MAG TPA: hypothetical protein VD695_07205 [Gaiellaceae bacterium]|nr:hypothetical protein [Gaiellaceae bacterium]